jgi:hypothetical protein
MQEVSTQPAEVVIQAALQGGMPLALGLQKGLVDDNIWMTHLIGERDSKYSGCIWRAAHLGVGVQEGGVNDIHVDELKRLQVIMQRMAHEQGFCGDQVQNSAAYVLQARGHRRQHLRRDAREGRIVVRDGITWQHQLIQQHLRSQIILVRDSLCCHCNRDEYIQQHCRDRAFVQGLHSWSESALQDCQHGL